jgi:hypothetical protein
MKLFDEAVLFRDRGEGELLKPTCLHDMLDSRTTVSLEAHWLLGVRARCCACGQSRDIMEWTKTTPSAKDLQP